MRGLTGLTYNALYKMPYITQSVSKESQTTNPVSRTKRIKMYASLADAMQFFQLLLVLPSITS